MTITPDTDSFQHRHIGPAQSDIEHMLKTVGYASLAELIDAAVPEQIRERDLGKSWGLEPHTETEALARLKELSERNVQKVQMIGQGFYDTITPPVIRRNVLENPAWYTAYTPYQPEISQGRLESLLNFQTMVSDLTGLPIANASMLDESSAAAEAVLLMRRANKKNAKGAVAVDSNIFPQTLKVLEGRVLPLGIEMIVTDLSQGLPDQELFGIVLQQPGADGAVTDQSDIIKAAKDAGAMVTVIADLLALTKIVEPGAQGADICVGNTQRLGVPLFFGGPHAAYMAIKNGLERNLPGRLVGVSTDTTGQPAYRLSLQTREQHIRREKATSNICTAQALLANTAAMYAVYHGAEGLTRIAEQVHQHAVNLAAGLKAAGVDVKHTSFFDTVAATGVDAAKVVADAAEAGINLHKVDDSTVQISTDEVTTDEHIATVLKAFGADGSTDADASGFGWDQKLNRTSEFLTHPNFTSVKSETQMLRYMRKLADRDLALDRTMIPLGSCTMKLNPTAGMEAIGYPGFASIHPYAPADQTEGWRELIAELEDWLTDITGYAGTSIAPNSGAQGEYAGLLAIRDYHRDRGDHERTLCFIPASAHGTNAASAVLAGLDVVVIKTAKDGTIDITDLDEKLEKYKDRIAAAMITYPSTHGVFEETVKTVCDRVHDAGGQVYIDGANMNALVGLARMGKFGGDVSHLNLHKTFTIPHGGGGPGVGPVCVGEHLVKYLPGAPAGQDNGRSGWPVTSGGFGSAGVLPIPYAYIYMMGGQALQDATEVAILSANYISDKLEDAFPTLYSGENGLVAHECILDLRELTQKTGVTAEDVAKRLIDYGFHAPTLAFPVAGTLMVEPTESEDLHEVDRFIDAMRQIRAEIDEIADGKLTVEESVLRNAPHTASVLLDDEWDRKYPRRQAAYPLPGMSNGTLVDKYFPPVTRIDQAGGDRNLVCSCPPLDAFDIEEN
ncbi:aminomethyl-transferring glycine dehydrogenase [Micrococcoides hystricis]|uniref:glycine dehydrogenase (aminomethyl-transferring) n=1 Tax=Micrococcoides hystricis TaxID=1572761 RepID=A0ABV6PCF7_9MICC